MLAQTATRAEVADGIDIPDLGCGWAFLRCRRRGIFLTPGFWQYRTRASKETLS